MAQMARERQIQSHHEEHEVNEENTCSQKIYAVAPQTFADYWLSLLYLCITFMSFMVKKAVLCGLCGKKCIYFVFLL